MQAVQKKLKMGRKRDKGFDGPSKRRTILQIGKSTSSSTHIDSPSKFFSWYRNLFLINLAKKVNNKYNMHKFIADIGGNSVQTSIELTSGWSVI